MDYTEQSKFGVDHIEVSHTSEPESSLDSRSDIARDRQRREQMNTPQSDQPTTVAFPIGINGPLAALVTDLESILGDLKFARYMAGTTLHNMAGMDSGNSDQSAAVRGLWSAALISYRRAFATGKSHAVPAASRFDIQGLRDHLLTAEQKATDRQLREFIDKHIAHRAVELEQIKLLVFLNPPPNPRGIMGVGPVTLFGITPSEDVINKLMEICDLLISSIDPEIRKMLDNAKDAWEADEAQMEKMYVQWAKENPNYSPNA